MKVTLVPATLNDFEDYYAIRCGVSDIFWMGYDGPPERELMKNIFMSRLGDSPLTSSGDKRIYMIKADAKNVGFVQFTINDEGLEFGYSVLDQERGKGYGTAGMKLAVAEALQYSSHCFAQIRDDNIASQLAMTHAGLKATNDYKLKLFPKSGMIKYRKYILF